MTAVVELLYFDGCPNHVATRELVDRVLSEMRIAADVQLVDVVDGEAALRQGFLGSPTVRVDGRDIEPGADERADFALTCRVYRTDDGFRGQPDEAWLRQALAEASA